MSKIILIEVDILKRTGCARIAELVLNKGAYLRQLAGLVINGSIPTDAAARLLVGY
jgi:hypothetical protein